MWKLVCDGQSRQFVPTFIKNLAKRFHFNSPDCVLPSSKQASPRGLSEKAVHLYSTLARLLMQNIWAGLGPRRRGYTLTDCRGHGPTSCGPCGRGRRPHALGIRRARRRARRAVIAVLARQILQQEDTHHVGSKSQRQSARHAGPIHSWQVHLVAKKGFLTFIALKIIILHSK